MHVTVEVVGEGTAEYDLPDDATYADPHSRGRLPSSGGVGAGRRLARFLATASSTPNRSGCQAYQGRIDGRRRVSGEGDPSDSPDSPDNIEIGTTASPDDRLDILRVLDAAMLETDAETVDAAIDAGDALVARFKRTDAVGALVATRPESDRVHVDAVAVRRRARRGRGIGSALVAETVRGAPSATPSAVVTAEFDPELKGFYIDLGFAVDSERDEVETGRLRGRCPAGGGSADAE